MARLIRCDATGPIEAKPQTGSLWICACGLSQNWPYCDGSHKKTADEPPGKLLIYDKADGENCRVEIGPIFKRDEQQRRHALEIKPARP